MKKIFSLLSLVILLSSSVNAQQKAKPASPVKTQAKEKTHDPAIFQSIWNNNIYLAKMILEIQKPVFDKEKISQYITSEYTVKSLEELKNLEQSFYSSLPREIIQEDKIDTIKTLIDTIQSVTSITDLNNLSIEIQKCIDQSLMTNNWDNKAWLNGFKTK